MTEPGKKRAYHSPDRLARSQETSRELRAAAERLFELEGYASVTMKAIARAARVAPATVYLHFPSKASLVGAIAQAITDEPGLSVERVEGEGSVEEQLRVGASILRRLNERSWLVAEILRTHAGTDLALKATAAEWQRRHMDAVRRGVMAVARAGELRPERGLEEAIDVLFAISGTDVYRVLVRERGWSHERYERWLAAFTEEHLLGPREPD